MRRLITIAAVLVAAVVITPATASAAPMCSEKAPGTPFLSGGVHSNGHAQCNVSFDAVGTLQYELGGTWHMALKGGSLAPPQVSGPWPGGAPGHATNYSWTGLDETPYCAFNWRVNVDYFQDAPPGTYMGSRLSATLGSTC